MKREQGNNGDNEGGGKVLPREREKVSVGRFYVEEKGRNYGKAKNPCR